MIKFKHFADTLAWVKELATEVEGEHILPNGTQDLHDMDLRNDLLLDDHFTSKYDEDLEDFLHFDEHGNMIEGFS